MVCIQLDVCGHNENGVQIAKLCLNVKKGKCMDAVQVDDANRKAGGFTHSIEVQRTDAL